MGGLIGALFGGGRRRYTRNVGLFGGNRGYTQQRRGLFSNPIIGALAVGALGYAANRFFGNRSQSASIFGGGSDPASRGGLGSSDWGNTDPGSDNNFNQSNGSSW